MAAEMPPPITYPSRSRSLSNNLSSSIRSRVNNSNTNSKSAFFRRVPLALLLIALLIAAPALCADAAEDEHHEDEHHEDEPPIEHLYEVYDSDASGGLNATELAGLFASLQEGAEAPAADAGAHAAHAHAADTPAAVAVTETLSIAHILEAGPYPLLVHVLSV
jgi:hypothetical protein